MYAAQTFNNIPSKDGRCIQIGWGQIEQPGMAFNQMMTFTLRSFDAQEYQGRDFIVLRTCD